jgi:uridine phosphorylase
MSDQNEHLYKDYPILEFDSSVPAIIEPSKILKPLDTMPERGVLCFFQDVIEGICGSGKAEIVSYTQSETIRLPIYSLDVENPISRKKERITVTHPGVGAPYSACTLEELIAKGCKKFIACGGAGVLDKEISVGNVVVPNSAVRDEGTSYHYLPPGREVAATQAAVAAIETTLKEHEVPYLVGKTWTTDGVYRETPAKIARRKGEDCLTVEMEAAAFFAISQFRKVTFGQILYGGDDVSGQKWDNRGWQKRASTREKLFWLAVESVLRL